MTVLASQVDITKGPPWWNAALHEIGTREVGDNGGPAIRRYCALAHCGQEGDPWCAIFVNAMLESVGIDGTKSASSQSFANSPEFVKLAAPCLGAITVFWRGSGPHSGIGHACEYRGELGDMVYGLGGNEGDMVQIEPFPKHSARFGLVGHFWPKHGPTIDPAWLGPIMMPAGTLAHVTTSPIKVV